MEEVVMSDEFNSNRANGEENAISDKSKVAAALLSLFLGMIGIHRFYLGRIGSGLFMLFLTIVGFLTTGLLFGFGILAFVGIWDFIDFIRILCNGLTDSQGYKLR